MPCDRKLKRNQTIQSRAAEIRKSVDNIARRVATGTVKVKIGPQGAIAFIGLSEAERDGVTDACAYRRIMATGSVLAKAKIMQAEMLSGTSINKQAIGVGTHSHDGGYTWHEHK